MTLIENWRQIATKAWSSRLTWLAVLLSAVEVGLPYLQILIPEGQVPQGRFAIAALIISAGAGVARLVTQPKLRAELEAKSGAVKS